MGLRSSTANICLQNNNAFPSVITAIYDINNSDWDGDSRPDKVLVNQTIPAWTKQCYPIEYNWHSQYPIFGLGINNLNVSMKLLIGSKDFYDPYYTMWGFGPSRTFDGSTEPNHIITGYGDNADEWNAVTSKCEHCLPDDPYHVPYYFGLRNGEDGCDFTVNITGIGCQDISFAPTGSYVTTCPEAYCQGGYLSTSCYGSIDHTQTMGPYTIHYQYLCDNNEMKNQYGYPACVSYSGQANLEMPLGRYKENSIVLDWDNQHRNLLIGKRDFEPVWMTDIPENACVAWDDGQPTPHFYAC